MNLRKCPKCKELGNHQSVSCPRCGVIFREHRIKRAIFWAVIVVAVGWASHDYVLRHIPYPGNVARK